jgi:hypothetical protein
MKNLILFALMSFGVASCGNNEAGHSTTESNSSISDTGASASQSIPDNNSSADTSAVQGKGTDKIPSRTGTTGQGNTGVTGAATGSPTGTGKDSVK